MYRTHDEKCATEGAKGTGFLITKAKKSIHRIRPDRPDIPISVVPEIGNLIRMQSEYADLSLNPY